jgi:hypothetical protein
MGYGVGFKFKKLLLKKIFKKPSWVLWYIFFLIEMQSLKFNVLICFVVIFLTSLNMLDLDNKCECVDVLCVWGLLSRLNILSNNFKFF